MQSPVPATHVHRTTELVSPEKVHADLEHFRQDLQRRLSAQIAHSIVSIELGSEGLVISLREAGYFDSGSAIPRPETEATLRQIAESLAGTRYDVRIEGHTDTTPIHNAEFDSNWELSSARATRIARLLLQMHTLSPQQLSAAGYAEYHPVAENDTADGRAENRRVDLVVIPRVFLDTSSPDTAEDKTGWRKIADQ
jgi:chemotaxis protein MotB